MSLTIANAALISLAGCGGGGGDAPAPGASTPVDSSPTVVVTTPTVTVTVPVVTPTTAVPTTVVDGALKNATVCMDKNTNGVCDPGEVQGKTDAAGNVTLAIHNADVDKFPLLAIAGTDAVDADHGTVTVTVAYTMSAPASKPALINPLTHLVQEAIASTGVTVAEAESAVQSSTGITASLSQDFTKVPAPTDGSPSAKVVARMAVVTTQAQVSNLASTVGTPAIDSAAITQADINRLINQRLLDILPELVAALSNPAITTLTTPAAREAAVVAALSSSLLTTASVPTLVGINNQNVANAAAGVTSEAPSGGSTMANLTFTNLANWYHRTLNATLAQGTPDASNNRRYVERRTRSNAGAVANWNYGTNPQDQSNLHWNGSAWVSCQLNHENKASVRDAAGNNTYSICDNDNNGRGNRATFDIAGKSMTEVYDQARAAGYTNLSITNSAAVLGSATFPAGSLLYNQLNTGLSSAYAYTIGSNSVVKKNAHSVGGDGRAGTDPICNTAAPNSDVATLETLVSTFKGVPCLYTQTAISTVNGTFTSSNPKAAQGASTLSIGTVGTVSISSAPTSFYTGNAKIKMAFTGAGANSVTYYSCQQEFITGFTHNCTIIGTGNYTITTLGDARVLTLSNPPAQAASFTFTRTFVERGGKVYYGYQSKLSTGGSARLNIVASSALLTKLGVPTVNPDAPMALTAASYQGTWDARDAAGALGGTAVDIGATGTTTCSDLATGAALTCTLTITNPTTGAYSGTVNSSAVAGTLNFITGLGTGTYSLPVPGSSVIVRR